MISLACLLLIWAALHDMAVRTIPNPVSLGLALCGAALAVQQDRLAGSLGAAGLVLVLAGFGFLRGWFGGGDAKLLAAAALLVPPAQTPSLVVRVLVAGGGLGLLYLLLSWAARRRALPSPGAGLLFRLWRTEVWRLRRRGPLPYGVAIALGAAFSLAAT